ncbi:MAG: lactate utilization protein LutB domain-containing protein, partial [Gammaproteobacteria bacterium]|nr:lactate utilization protein LutB domain-containing protein [Gammaproteobacteria bacterium]
PLPDMLRKLRERGHDQRLVPPRVRAALRLWAYFAKRPRLYRMATRAGVAVLGALGRRRGRFRRLPFAGGWTDARDLPAPEGRTFHAALKVRGGRK